MGFRRDIGQNSGGGSLNRQQKVAILDDAMRNQFNQMTFKSLS